MKQKTSSLPRVRVEPGFRRELEMMLDSGETLSAFVEPAVRFAKARRRDQAEFVRRGLVLQKPEAAGNSSLFVARSAGELCESTGSLVRHTFVSGPVGSG